MDPCLDPKQNFIKILSLKLHPSPRKNIMNVFEIILCSSQVSSCSTTLPTMRTLFIINISDHIGWIFQNYFKSFKLPAFFNYRLLATYEIVHIPLSNPGIM